METRRILIKLIKTDFYNLTSKLNKEGAVEVSDPPAIVLHGGQAQR